MRRLAKRCLWWQKISERARKKVPMNGEMKVIMITLYRHLFTFHVWCLIKYDFFFVYTPFLTVFQFFFIFSHFILFQLNIYPLHPCLDPSYRLEVDPGVMIDLKRCPVNVNRPTTRVLTDTLELPVMRTEDLLDTKRKYRNPGGINVPWLVTTNPSGWP